MVPLGIVEVLGHDDHVRTWVSEVRFARTLEQDQLVVMKAIMEQKPFLFGIVPDHQRYLVVMHSTRDKVRRSQCVSALRDVFKVARVEASVEKTVTFNGYHLELFGLRPNPGPALPKKVEAEVELDEEEQEKVWEALLPPDYAKSICMAEVDAAFAEALRQKEEQILAQRSPKSSLPGFAFSCTDGPCILWCTHAPLRLEVASERILREWQKLEWVLLRSENEEMKRAPTMAQFADFYAIYKGFSIVHDEAKLLQQAFATFAEHVKETTGQTLVKKELSQATLNSLKQRGAGKHCQTCNRALSEELTMDRDGYMIPKHVHGMFCSSKCAVGRCKGCSFPLDDRQRCVKRCGIRHGSTVRRATWREYFEQYPAWDAEAKDWCEYKMRTSKSELLDSPMDTFTYGGYYHVSPDAFF